MKNILFIVIILIGMQLQAQSFKTKNVILIVLDGYRWQELFTGADSTLMKSKIPEVDMSVIKKAYWNNDINVRRKMLMPFFWGEIASQGQLYGNRNKGSNVNVTNQYWFSYPGYNEILTGCADDSVNSNDKKYNKNTTVFEVANNSEQFKGRIAAYTSWDCFPFIFNQPRSGIYVNAGNQPVEGKITCREELLNNMTANMEEFTEGVRYDIFTYYDALEYLKEKSPRLFFMQFDETDDFGHMGMYDRLLNTAHQDDKIIGELWHWLQSQPQYKDQTTLILTCDHGRGGSANDQWFSHGAKISGSNQTWIAVIGPDTPAKGEITSGQFYSNQIAKTIATLLDFNYNNPKAGEALKSVYSK